MSASNTDQRHTIVLLQYNSSPTSRTFLDYETVSSAMDGVCGVYERELKALNPGVANMTYDISDLFTYLDQLASVSLLVHQEAIQGYLPRDKEWIKRQILTHLRKQSKEIS